MHHSKNGRPTSQLGQSRPKFDVRVPSAFHLTATRSQTSHHDVRHCSAFRPFEWRSGVDQIDRTKKIRLADIDAIMAEDGVGHRDVEKRIGYRHLQ